MNWPDLEEIIPRCLTAALGVESGTDTFDDLSVFNRISIVGGPDDGFVESALVDVESFAPTREGARNLAEDTRQVVLSLAGTDASDTGSELIDTVRTETRPRWVNYRNPDLQRYVGSYRITTRLQ